MYISPKVFPAHPGVRTGTGELGDAGQLEKGHTVVQAGLLGALMARRQRSCSARHCFDIVSKNAVSTNPSSLSMDMAWIR